MFDTHSIEYIWHDGTKGQIGNSFNTQANNGLPASR